MSAKEGFAHALNLLGSYGNPNANECEIYGMSWGCGEDCPVLKKCECELYTSVEDYKNQMDK